MDCRKNLSIEGERVVDENSVDVLTRALTGVIEGGTATSAQIGRPAAGKTGTTQDNRDAWFAGYVPQLATVVWMGYPVEDGPDGKPGTGDDVSPLMQYCGFSYCRPVHGVDVTGGSFPASIWSAYMVAALDGLDVEYFVEPAYEPTTVINPIPPPPPEKDKDDKDDEEDSDDRGNGNGHGHGNDDDD
jgi:penicillin-binding protein 1A